MRALGAPNVYVYPVYVPIPPNLSACVPVTGRRGHVGGSALRWVKY